MAQPQRQQPATEGMQLPASIDVEQGLIGSVLLRNGAYAKVSEIVTTEMFTEEVHRRIWGVIGGLIEKGQPAKVSTLKTYLGDAELAPGVTVNAYIARLAAEGATVMAPLDDAKFLRDLWIRRGIIAIGQEAVEAGFNAPVGKTAEAIFSEVESKLDQLRPAESKGQGGFRDFNEAMARASTAAADAYRNQGRIIGLSTGLPALDRALNGLKPGNLLVLGGRPGMGKTALATNIILAVSRQLAALQQDGEQVGVAGFFSMEMPDVELAQRIMSDISNVPFYKVQNGFAEEQDVEWFLEAERTLRNLPLRIDETGSLTIAALRNRARELKRKFGLKILVVDYIQLMVGSGRAGNNRTNDVTEITTGLKALAKELEVPIIALSQLSRQVEERPDKRPMLSDLRESGSIEQDADVVMFVYREEEYVGRAEPKEGTSEHTDWEREMRRCHGVAQVIIAKNRHGKKGAVTLGFDGPRTRFLNEPDQREEETASVRPQKEKQVSLPAQASILYGVFKEMSKSAPIPSSVEALKLARDLPKMARVISVADARQKFKAEVMPEAEDTPLAKAFSNAVQALRKNSLAFYTGSEDAGWYIWCPEFVAKD
jgi:replicative DNA helicase